MMNFKIHKGFTLIEVLLALLVSSMLLVPLFSLYNIVVQQVVVRSQRIQAMLVAKHFLFEARKQAGTEKSFTLEQVNENFNGTLRYERTTISMDYVFAPHQMMKELITISWKQFGTIYRDQLVTYMYAPEMPKKSEDSS